MELLVSEVVEHIEINQRRKYFRECTLKPIVEFTLTQFIKKSESFPIPFPIDTVKCSSITKFYADSPDREIIWKGLLKNVMWTYPIVHEDFFQLAIDFLEHKKKFGSVPEQVIYKDMNLIGFISRLLKKRAVTFFGASDKYLLIGDKSGNGGWKTVGTQKEMFPMICKNCLSVDEMKLSALITISGPSYFLNGGSRTNGGIPSTQNDFEKYGIIFGMIGCKFLKAGVMDYEDMVVDTRQNTRIHGFGQFKDIQEYPDESIFSNRADFLRIVAKYYYKMYLPDWQKANEMYHDAKQKKIGCVYEKVGSGNSYVANDIYRTRIRRMVEVLLLETNGRGLAKNKKVFLHIGGYGPGSHQLWPGEEKLFITVFVETVSRLTLPHISDIFFNGIPEESYTGVNTGRIGKNTIMLYFGIRNAHDKLDEDHAGKLLVVTYPGDGNALAGNEWWMGMLAASSATIEASSSQIAELHNTYINPMLSGNNLRVACIQAGKVLSIKEYFDLKLVLETAEVRKKWEGSLGDL